MNLRTQINYMIYGSLGLRPFRPSSGMTPEYDGHLGALTPGSHKYLRYRETLGSLATRVTNYDGHLRAHTGLLHGSNAVIFGLDPNIH
jgi:hypothetical protein